MVNGVRFVLVSETIVAFDGDTHRVSANELVGLYGLPRNQCLLIRDEKDLRGFRDREHDVWLYPRVDGDYREHLQRVLKHRGFA